MGGVAAQGIWVGIGCLSRPQFSAAPWRRSTGAARQTFPQLPVRGVEQGGEPPVKFGPCGEHSASIGAGQRAHYPACFGNQERSGHPVPGLEVVFVEGINGAVGYGGEAQGGWAAAPDVCNPGKHTDEGCGLAFAPGGEVGESGADQRGGQRHAAAHGQAPAVDPGAFAAYRRVGAAQGWCVHDADGGAVLVLGRDADGELVGAAQVVDGAVERVDHPPPACAAGAGELLLAEKGVVGPGSADAVGDRVLRRGVGFGHRVSGTRLVGGGACLDAAVAGARQDSSGGLRGRQGELQQVAFISGRYPGVAVHVSSSRSSSSSSSSCECAWITSIPVELSSSREASPGAASVTRAVTSESCATVLKATRPSLVTSASTTVRSEERIAACLTRESSGLYSVRPRGLTPATPMNARSQFHCLNASSAIPPVRLNSPDRTWPPVTMTRMPLSLPSSFATGRDAVTT